MEVEQDKIITDLLFEVEKTQFVDARVFFEKYKKEKITIDQIRFLISELEGRGLIDIISEGGFTIRLTSLGKRINQTGGYEVYTTQRRAEIAEELRLSEITKQKLLDEARLTKLELEDFPKAKRRANWALFLSAIAILIALLPHLLPFLEKLF